MNNKGFKKLFTGALALALVAVTVTLTSCDEKIDNPDGYNYVSYTSALGTNWNPHTWETSADDTILSYVSAGFVDLSIKNSTTGEYQWVYEMATEITDVTATHQDDLETYNVTLPSGASEASEVEEGFVYEIKLNQRAKWSNGEVINADSYVNSMKLLLDPTMHNYRANNTISGESELAGSYNYYYQGSSGHGAGFQFGTDYETDKSSMTFSWTDGYYFDYYADYGYSPAELLTAFGWKDDDTNKAFLEAWEGKTIVECLADTGAMKEFLEDFWVEAEMADWTADDYDSLLKTFNVDYTFGEASWDTVGLYKVDDYTIRYVCQNQLERDYFLTAMTSIWLVYEPLYTSLYDTTGDLKTTTYCTSVATTVSYGPYTLASFQPSKQMTFTRNPYWYGYTADEKGNLTSTTENAGVAFMVDGEYKQQYVTDKIVINVLTDAAAKQQFMKGKLTEWAPSSDELSAYTTSTQLYQVDETYTMRLFYNTNLDKLKEMDKNGNAYSVVMSNEKFREALSLSIDRSEFVKSTAGYKPACYLINTLYYYDVYNDPTSIFRNSESAMEAVVARYGIEYGEGKTYATLEAAYQSVTGYNLTEARKLMKEAYDELVAAGLYAANADIKIKLGWKKGALESDDYAQVSSLQQFLNAAVTYEGSQWGTITLEAVGDIADRYSAVAEGTYAIGWGAWGGAAFYPFTMMQCYMDPNYTDLHEAGCWDPTTYTFTLSMPKTDDLAGEYEDVTMTAQQWSKATSAGGKYANSTAKVKCYVTAQLEKAFLELDYCTPICTTTGCSLLSYQVNYYTETYNIMYGFGGLRLMTYNYTNAEWAAYVKSQGNKLSYN